MDLIKILIVDDHPMMREALAAALMEETDMQVVGQAAEGNEALRILETCKPDVILMDLLMQGMGGLEAIEKIMALHSSARILVFTSLEDEEKILAAVQAGALGYFPKTAPRVHLLEAIRKIADGIPYLPSGITLKLFKSIRETKPTQRSAIAEPLTGRQEEILNLLGEGRTDKEIGQLLHLEEATVRSHVHHILQRLGLQNRAQAIVYANKRK